MCSKLYNGVLFCLSVLFVSGNVNAEIIGGGYGDISSVVSVTASSSFSDRYASNIINASGLDQELLCHSMFSSDMWMSETGGGGSVSNHPFGLDCSAWVMFEFDKIYSIEKMMVWNWNGSFLNRGLKNVQIHYSIQSTNIAGDWKKLGDFELAQASGTVDYTFNTEIDFFGANAKYVVITVDSNDGNWGVDSYGDFYGLSEIRFAKARFVEVDKITATAASEYSLDRGISKTIDESGIIGDLQGISKYDMWMSTDGGGGTVSNHPFGLPNASWIKYSLDDVYYLKNIWLWNFNMAQGYSGRGLRNISIHYSSIDSSNISDWVKLGDFEIAQAGGVAEASADLAIDFEGESARYIVLTVNEMDGNWGDPNYYGLSEVRIETAKVYASNPSPENECLDVRRNLALSWQSGDYCSVGHDLYMSNDLNQITAADNNSTCYTGRINVENWTADLLDYNTTYYWRVDEVDVAKVWQGPVWSFTTADYVQNSIHDYNVTVDTSSSYGGRVGQMTIDGSGLDGAQLLHDADKNNMWMTVLGGGGSSTNHPFGLDSPAWIKFNFDNIYSVHDIDIWNFNMPPQYNLRGLRNASIHYSLNGSPLAEDWKSLGSYELNLASGADNYLFGDAIDFGGVFAKYVVISADAVDGNWGGDYYGLSEVRFNTSSILYPGHITATASSSYGPRLPIKTIDESGMTGGIHDTSSSNMWMSASGGGGSVSNHPFGLDGSAWVKYEFDNVYDLTNINIWNCNMSGNYANRGLRNVAIHYSINGSNNIADWTKLGDFELSKGTGALDYRCNNQIGFDNISAKYVVITADQTDGNWGDPYYYSLSEVRFGLSNEHSANPVPLDGDAYVTLDNFALGWTSGTGAGLVGHDVYLGTDFERVYCAEPGDEYSDVYLGRMAGTSLIPAGIKYGQKYYWRVDEVYNSHKAKGRLWEFDTPEILQTKISNSMPKVNSSIQIESVVLLPADISLPGNQIDFYVRDPQGQTSLISQVSLGSSNIANWTPTQLGKHQIWSEINTHSSQEVEIFVTPVVRNFHYWWPNEDQKWITSCIVHGVEPTFWKDRGVLATKWKYGDDWPYDRTVSSYYDHWSDIEAGYGGITIDEFPYQGVENVVMGDALCTLKANNPEIFICAYSVKVDLANTDLISDFSNVDLLLMETYAAGELQYVRFDRYDSAVDAGLGDKALAAIAVEDQNVNTVAELRKQFAYVRATRPEMTGVAIYGTHVDDDKHYEMMKAVDQAIYDYYLRPALLLTLNRPAGNLTVKNIGSLPIGSVNVILHRTNGDTVTTISSINANAEAVVSIPYDCVSADIEEDSQRYTIVKNPI